MSQRRELLVPGTAPVDHALWTPAQALPLTRAEVSWSADSLTCRLICQESNPRTTYFAPNDPVHKDSCLEFFLAPWPGRLHYLNLEANAAGTFWAAFGAPGERPLLADDLRAQLSVTAERFEDAWQVTYRVPLALLNQLGAAAGLPELAFTPGTELAANFYKCGDDTAVEHYGAWQPIDHPEPSFHQPAQFGRLVLT